MSNGDKKVLADLLIEALDDEVDADEGSEAIVELGIDVSRLAARLRQQVADHEAADRERRWAEMDRRRREDLGRLSATRDEEEQLALPGLLEVLRGLLSQAGTAAGMNYMKYESAKEEDVRQAIRALRHLLRERQGDE